LTYLPIHNIVDIDGLSDILSCSKSLLLKKWREYPHFFIGNGNDARGARFDINDVLTHLKSKCYASMGQENKEFQGPSPDQWAPSDNKDRIQNKRGREEVGVKRKALSEKLPTFAPGKFSTALLSGIKQLS